MNNVFMMDWISSMWMSSGWCPCYFLKLDGVDISRERAYLNSAYDGFVLKNSKVASQASYPPPRSDFLYPDSP